MEAAVAHGGLRYLAWRGGLQATGNTLLLPGSEQGPAPAGCQGPNPGPRCPQRVTCSPWAWPRGSAGNTIQEAHL